MLLIMVYLYPWLWKGDCFNDTNLFLDLYICRCLNRCTYTWTCCNYVQRLSRGCLRRSAHVGCELWVVSLTGATQSRGDSMARYLCLLHVTIPFHPIGREGCHWMNHFKTKTASLLLIEMYQRFSTRTSVRLALMRFLQQVCLRFYLT